MGADLAIDYVEIRASEDEALARLANLVINEDTLDRFIDNASYFEYEDEDFTPELAEKMRERIKEAVSVVYSTRRRDTSWLNIDGDRTFVFTGGMSWGEEPTEAMEDFRIFNEFLGYPAWASPASDEAKEWEKGKVK